MSHQENTQRLVEEIDRLHLVVESLHAKVDYWMMIAKTSGEDAYREAYYTASFIADGYEQINQCWDDSRAKKIVDQI